MVVLKQTVALDGDWDLTGFDQDGTRKASLAGRVPGHVHPDLQRAGLIPDPFWRNQADLCQWVEHWTWRYTREFDIPEGFIQPWTILRFEGLDTFATIYVNGRLVGTTANMFIPHEFEIGDWLLPGRNQIEVRFAPAVKSVADKPLNRYWAAFNPTGERVYARKMQCSYGWDWVHRLVSAGIWRSCSLIAYQEARIEDLFVHTTRLSQNEAELGIELTLKSGGTETVSAFVEIADPDGRIVWQKRSEGADGPIMLNAQIADPRWWWPVGYGGQPLYRVRVTLHDAADQMIDEREIETGLRTVALEEIPDEDGSSFTLVVNETRIFVKGGNWVPADPFPSQVTPGRYARLIDQARAARLNLLRAWGGGIYEGEAFWNECNRTGVMVSQDFLLACSQYPEDDPEFVSALRVEFTAAIKMLRNHPALAFWCGDNELGLGKRPDDYWSGKKIAQEVTGPLCAALDPSRSFRLTSPYGGDPNNSPLIGDYHTNAQFSAELSPQNMHDYRRVIADTTGRFMSEHAVSGSPTKHALLKFMTEQDLSDPAMWEYHTKDNPYSGCPRTLFQIAAQGAEALYGDSSGDVDKNIRHLEYVQYEFIRLAMESARRRKFWCSGIQFWMYNDCWPAAGWSILDYWGNRKAAWYGMNSGFRAIIAAQEITADTLRWWVCSDLLKAVPVEMLLRVQPWQGEPRWAKTVTLEAPVNASIVAAELPLSEIHPLLRGDAMLVCDLRYPGGTDRSLYYPGLPREMQQPLANLTVTEHRSADRGEGEITIHAENYARVVTLASDVDFSDNYFDLLPGETRTISWHSPLRPWAEPIPVTCWNV